MKNMEISKYLAALESKNYTPGGGSAVCLITNIALSLILKSVNITVARKSFENLNDIDKNKLLNAMKVIEDSKAEFFELAKLDEEAFNNFMIAFKNSSDLKDVTYACFDVPYRTFLKIKEIYKSINSLKIVDSIISDYKIGLDYLKQSMNGCLVTMEININNYDELKDKYNKCLGE